MQSDKSIRIFEGGVAIVTGGASGIGRALAEELIKRGCEVVLADLQIELAQEIASEINASGGKAMVARVDVRAFSAMQQLVQDTRERCGRLDYIFNNAGIAIGGNVNHYGIDDWNQMVDTNLRGVINGIQAAYPIMISQGFGHIVNTASMAGLMPSPGATAYAATKYAVVGLSQSLRTEGAVFGVRVSALCPGVVRTPILDGGGKYGKMLVDIPPDQVRAMWERFRPMSPNVFAEKVLNAVAKNKAMIIVPSWWRSIWWMNRLAPSLGAALARKRFQEVARELGILQKS